MSDKPDSPSAVPFRFDKIADKVLVTNDAGDYVFLTDDEFKIFADDGVAEGTELHEKLTRKQMLHGAATEDYLVDKIRSKHSFLNFGPYLHIAILTLRCNEICVYCHASRRGMEETSFDMSVETAHQVVDLAFKSPSPNIIIEFQGGEPLANWDALKYIIEYSVEKNKTEKKELGFSLVSNMSLMDEEKLEYLMANNVQMCTSIDGPKDLHDGNRKLLGGSSYDRAVYWMKRVDDEYRAKGLETDLYHVEALLTTTRNTVKRPRDVVDEYISLGRKAIFLRPLNPFGFAKSTFDRIGYTTDEFLAFYREAVDYMIELNRQGVEILERTAAILLTKIMTPVDPNYLDLRSPCGAGVGQIAYNYDGALYTCDEGRMVSRMGDDIFQIGHVKSSAYNDVVGHETVKAIAVASCLDGIPGCTDCVFKPYCGVCPVYNYAEQGTIFGQTPTNERCKLYIGVLRYLFEKLSNADDQLLDILSKWTIMRDRDVYFVHE